MDPVPDRPQVLAKPIMFPPDGSALPLKSWEGEWPDPLSACPGYRPPSGLALTLQLGLRLPVQMTQYAVVRNEASPAPIEACGFDATSYVNHDPESQRRGRGILTNMGAVVIVPMAPLEAGAYSVSLTANSKPYAWSFKITP